MGLVDERQGRDILGLPEIMAAAPKLAERTVGLGAPGPGRGKKTADGVSRLEHGNSGTYLAARLKRDHPEIAAAEKTDGRVLVA